MAEGRRLLFKTGSSYISAVLAILGVLAVLAVSSRF